MLPSFSDSRHGVKRRRFDLALVLLARAIDHGSGTLSLPSVRDDGEVALVVRELLADGLIEEVRDGESRYGLRVTTRGLRFVGNPPLESVLEASA